MPGSMSVQTADAASPDEWLSTAEAATASGYSAWWIRRLIASGELKAHRRAGGGKPHWRIRRSDLNAFLAGPSE